MVMAVFLIRTRRWIYHEEYRWRVLFVKPPSKRFQYKRTARIAAEANPQTSEPLTQHLQTVSKTAHRFR